MDMYTDASISLPQAYFKQKKNYLQLFETKQTHFIES